jgi:hypothetical protein
MWAMASLRGGRVLDKSRRGQGAAALDDPHRGEAGSPSDKIDVIQTQAGVSVDNDPNPADRIVPNAISRRPNVCQVRNSALGDMGDRLS